MFSWRSLQRLRLPRLFNVESKAVRRWNSTVSVLPRFETREDNHTTALLKRQPEYAAMLFSPEEFMKSIVSSKLALHPVASEFHTASLQPDLRPLSDDIYYPVITRLIDNVQSLTDQDILYILACSIKFPWGPVRKHPNYERFWKTLDVECVRRAQEENWSYDKMFEFDDAFARLGIHKFTDFHWNLVKKCFRKCERLNKSQFVRFMFCLSQTRNIPKSISTYELEYNLNRHVSELTATEISTVALGLFKTSTPIRSAELLARLMNIVMAEADKITSIGLAAVCKMFRLSVLLNNEDLVLKFMETFLPQVDRLSLTACLHLVLIGTNQIKVFHPELATKVVKRFEEEVSSLRLKELERIALWLSIFQRIPSSNLVNLILEEVRNPARQKELDDYGKCLPSVLHYLSVFGIFDETLTSRVLDKDYVKKYFDKTHASARRDMLCLDISTQLEVPDYSGNRLSDVSRNYLVKFCTLWADTNQCKKTILQTLFGDVAKILSESPGGKPFLTSVLAHYHAVEIVFCTDLEGNAVEVPSYLTSLEQWEIKYINESDLKSIVFHCFACAGRNVVVHNSRDVIGGFLLRERQLRKLGYVPHRVYVYDWLPASAAEKSQIIKDLIRKGCEESRRTQEARNQNASTVSQ